MTSFQKRSLPSLNSLRALDAVARCGGMRAAAQDLGVVPGAVRQHLAALEDHFGVPLVNRDGARITLNDAGRRLADSAGVAFGIISRAADEVASRGSRFRLRLGAPMPLAAQWLMPRISRLQVQAPSLDLDVVPVPVGISLSDRADIDALIVGGEYKPLPDIDATPFMEDAFGPVYADHLGHDADGHVSADTMVVLVAQDVAYLWDDWFHESGNAPIRFRKRMEVADLTLALSAARSGLGITIAPLASIQTDIATGTLVAPFGFVKRPIGYRFCCRVADREKKTISALRDWLRSEGAKPLPGTENLPSFAE